MHSPKPITGLPDERYALASISHIMVQVFYVLPCWDQQSIDCEAVGRGVYSVGRR